MIETTRTFNYPFTWDCPQSLGVSNIKKTKVVLVFPKCDLIDGKDFIIDSKNGRITFLRFGRLINAIRIYNTEMISVKIEISYEKTFLEKLKEFFNAGVV